MIETWKEIAAEKRPAEDRLIDRYRSAFFKGDSPEAGRCYPTQETPWGLGREFFSGFFATSIGRRSAWPETQLILEFFWDIHPTRHFVAMRPIWPLGHSHDPEPPYNDVLSVNLVEAMHTGRENDWTAVQPGPMVYVISELRADPAEPPAPGDPPDELLTARAEVDELRARSRHAPAES